MATTIQFKRGNNAGFGSVSLAAGEPAFVLDTQKLYIGDGTDKVLINPIDKPAGLDTANKFTKVQVNEYGQVVLLENLVAADIPDISYTQVTGLGTAAVADIGTSEGEIPALDVNGKLPVSTIPAVAITDVYVVADEAEMVTLPAEPGDIAILTDSSKTYILKQSPASTLANWVELLVPPDSVLSVNSKTGVVVLGAEDIDMTGYALPVSYSPVVATDTIAEAVGKLERNFDSYAPLDSPALTGTPTAPTVTPSTDSTTKIATTAFVQSVVATIDGGTF